MPKSPEEKWEDGIRNLMESLQFGDITAPDPKLRGGVGFQLDASGGEDETYLAIDATVTADPIAKYGPHGPELAAFLERRVNIEKFINNNFKKKYKNVRWVVWIKGSVTKQMRERASGTNTSLLSEVAYLDFLSRSKTLDKLALDGQEIGIQRQMLRYRMLKLIGVKLPEINSEELTDVPAIKFLYGKKTPAYIFAMKADSLIKSCYVLKREVIGTAGYQRLLDEDRIKEIREYIERKGTSFPNNIIINYVADEENKEIKIVEKVCKKTTEEGVFDCIISLPKIYCSAQIIDGQHRLFAFDDINDEKLREGLKLDVLAFSNLSENESARIFIDLNEEQKRLDPNLYWEIVGAYLPQSSEGAISHVVQQLNRGKGSVFRGKVRILSEKGEEAPIKLANFCKGISDRRLMYGIFAPASEFDKEDAVTYGWNFFVRAKKNKKSAIALAQEQLNLYFKTILAHDFSKSWKSFVMTNTGLNVMLRVLVETLKYYHAKERRAAITKQEYKKILDAMQGYVKRQSSVEIADLLQSSSEGARGRVARGIFENIHRHIPEFAQQYFWDLRESELLDLTKRSKKNTENKKRKSKELVELYIEMKENKYILWAARRMNKDFDDAYSARVLKKFSGASEA